jgi:hypothetical protein
MLLQTKLIPIPPHLLRKMGGERAEEEGGKREEKGKEKRKRKGERKDSNFMIPIAEQ